MSNEMISSFVVAKIVFFFFSISFASSWNYAICAKSRNWWKRIVIDFVLKKIILFANTHCCCCFWSHRWITYLESESSKWHLYSRLTLCRNGVERKNPNIIYSLVEMANTTSTGCARLNANSVFDFFISFYFSIFLWWAIVELSSA